MPTALVTGATRGAGRAIAVALARAGWQVCALGRDRRALEDLRADHGITPYAMDLTDRDELRALAQDVTPQALIHAALRWPGAERFEDLAEAEIDMALEVNLNAMMHLTRAMLPSMRAARSGAIRVVTPLPGHAASAVESAVTGAVIAFARSLDAELAPHGISVAATWQGAALFAEAGVDILRDLAPTPSRRSPEYWAAGGPRPENRKET